MVLKHFTLTEDTPNDYDVYQRRISADFRWATCNTCGGEATRLHNNPECHSCSDWSGCGEDCTFSGWYCTNCDITEEID